MSVFKRLFTGLSSALPLISLAVSGPAYAYKPPKRVNPQTAGGFIDTYGRAFAAYSRRIADGGDKMQAEERRRLYDELFADAKKAYEAERAAKAEPKRAIASGIDDKVEQEQPALAADRASQPQNTGEIGHAGGAEAVSFGKRGDSK